MDNNRFFTLETEARQQFYQVPKAFMCEDSKYFNMHPMSKLLYGVLADRNSLSMQNGWVDELNRIYFIFNQEDLCKIMGIAHPMTLRKYLKELEKNGLLFRKRMGLNQTDRMYLLQIESPQTLINSLIDKNYPSGQIKIIYQDRQKLSTNNTDNNKTDLNKSSSSKKMSVKQDKREEDEENKKDLFKLQVKKIDKVISHAKLCGARLQRRTIERFVYSYGYEKVIQAITTGDTVGYNKIKNHKAYINKILNEMNTSKIVNINTQSNSTQTQKNNTFNDFKQREYSSEDFLEMEKLLLKE